MPYIPGPEDDIPAPDELTCLILWHGSPYPEDDPRREWIAQALRQWAGEKCDTERRTEDSGER